MSEETVRCGFEFKKILFYEGHLEVPKSIFNKGKAATEQYLMDESYMMDDQHEEKEIGGIGVGCSFCSNEITHTDQIFMKDESNGFVNIMCDECGKEAEEADK